MRLDIECEYCGSVYDFNKHRSCPNCCAVPNKELIAAAKAAAKAEKQAAASEQKKPKPAGKFMVFLVRMIPVWIALMVIMTIIPAAKKDDMADKAAESIKFIDEPVFVDHNMNEKFIYDGVAEVEADEAFFAEGSELIDVMLPTGMKLLAVHLKASTDGGDHRDVDYYDVYPYITNGEYCRQNVSSGALNACQEDYAKNVFNLGSVRYFSETDGYLCFLAEEGTETVYLCYEEVHTENHMRQLDRIHRIKLEVKQ